MDKIEFWNRVKELLVAKKISQPELSKRMGLNSRKIANWIQNEYLPDAEQLAHMAEIFEVSMEFLVFGQEKGNVDIQSRFNELQAKFNILQNEYTKLYKEYKHFKTCYEDSWRRIEKAIPIQNKEPVKKEEE